MKTAFFNWSGGKDSAMALYKVMQAGEYEINALLTNISRDYERISMHGVRKSILWQQVANLKLKCPLYLLELWEGMSMEDYSQAMQQQLAVFRAKSINHAIFGDIFLEDLRIYREQRLREVAMQAVFPLWGQNTRKLLEEFIALGFRAVIVCCNARLLDESYAGRIIDADFLKDLPPNVDPCGENGEYHSFVFDGPIFEKPVDFALGEKVLRDYGASDGNWDTKFWYQDLI